MGADIIFPSFSAFLKINEHIMDKGREQRKPDVSSAVWKGKQHTAGAACVREECGGQLGCWEWG